MHATARAHPNIAFIKYWGNRNDALRLPENSSISMNLDSLFTQTRVTWDSSSGIDSLNINGQSATEAARERVATHLDLMRSRLGIDAHAQVESTNNFPMGAGIASSASAFAALTVAAAGAAGVTLSERELTTLARRGSGSAARSVPSGFVTWYAAEEDSDSYAESVALPDHWSLVDVIAVISQEHKAVGSSKGHQSARTSILQAVRVADAEARLAQCVAAIETRDFDSFADVVELDSNLMHSVMMTSQPPLFYWEPATLAVMARVRGLRAEGLPVCYTLDAGPNVHCICAVEVATQVHEAIAAVPGVTRVLQSKPGGAACLIPDGGLNGL